LWAEFIFLIWKFVQCRLQADTRNLIQRGKLSAIAADAFTGALIGSAARTKSSALLFRKSSRPRRRRWLASFAGVHAIDSERDWGTAVQAAPVFRDDD
jgi:hypothetical protein